MTDIKGREIPSDYVRFFSFAAGEFEDEELFYCATRLALGENRKREEVEKEFSEKLRYVKNDSEPNHPFETWGPQELADRLNSYKDIEVES